MTGFEFAHKNTHDLWLLRWHLRHAQHRLDTNGKLVGLVMDTRGSANGQNRSIQEATFGFNQTIWKNPKYGAVQFMGQYSYLTRTPWYVSPPAPPQCQYQYAVLQLALHAARLCPNHGEVSPQCV